MKTIRVPWIRCRADEAGAQGHEIQWRNRSFRIVAYSEREAREWWSGMSEADRRDALGIGDGDDWGQTRLF